MLADTRFVATHLWPLYERRGYPDIDAYLDGYYWTFPKKPKKNSENLVIGRAIDYTVEQPIVDRSVANPADRPLIFNFYPGPGSTETAILTVLDEADGKFFGKA
jgi:hypothetical protein